MVTTSVVFISGMRLRECVYLCYGYGRIPWRSTVYQYMAW